MRQLVLYIFFGLMCMCNGKDDPSCINEIGEYNCYSGNLVKCKTVRVNHINNRHPIYDNVIEDIINCDMGCAHDINKGDYCLNKQNKCISVNENTIVSTNHHGELYDCTQIIDNNWNTYYEYVSNEHDDYKIIQCDYKKEECTISITDNKYKFNVPQLNFSHDVLCNYKYNYLQCHSMYPKCNIKTNDPDTNDCKLHCNELNNHCIENVRNKIDCTIVCNIHEPIKIFVNNSNTIFPNIFMMIAIFIIFTLMLN